MLQSLRTLKVFFANLSCNFEFGYASDMRQLQRYIERFWVALQRQEKNKKKFSDEEIKKMKRMYGDLQRKFVSHVIYDMMWGSPCLNVIAIVEVCFVIREKGINLKELINVDKDDWGEIFGFLGEQQRDILYSVFHLTYSDIKKLLH